MKTTLKVKTRTFVMNLFIAFVFIYIYYVFYNVLYVTLQAAYEICCLFKKFSSVKIRQY